MRKTRAAAICLLSLATAAKARGDDPLTRPVAPEAAKRWLTPQAPVRVYGNFYLVGFGGLDVGLIKTSAGLILIDGAVPQAVPAIEANIRKLGFRLSDIKLILSTEPHADHAGGLAALARDSGAEVVASAASAEVLRRGASGPDDPQYADLPKFPAVAKVRAVRDGETLRLGETIVTALATPGHTAGSMSWSWRSCAGRRCRTLVFASSLNPISSDGYRFSAPKQAAYLAAFQKTLRTVAGLRCDLLVTAHPDQSDGDVKLAALRRRPDPNPFLDPGACRQLAAKFGKLLEARIAHERGS